MKLLDDETKRNNENDNNNSPNKIDNILNMNASKNKSNGND